MNNSKPTLKTYNLYFPQKQRKGKELVRNLINMYVIYTTYEKL